MSDQSPVLDSPPAHAAWISAGEPTVAGRITPARTHPCALCGQATRASLHYRDVIDRRFTDFEHWNTNLNHLCLPCAWSYTTDKPRLTIITADGHLDEAKLTDMQLLLTHPLAATMAIVCGGRRRKYVLPTARWGHVNGEHTRMPWTTTAAHRLQAMCRLREMPGVTATTLHAVQPPITTMRAIAADQWALLLEDWTVLQPWREHTAWWPTALTLSAPTKPAPCP